MGRALSGNSQNTVTCLLPKSLGECRWPVLDSNQKEKESKRKEVKWNSHFAKSATTTSPPSFAKYAMRKNAKTALSTAVFLSNN